MSRHRSPLAAAVIALALSVAGCGFHLRGAVSIPADLTPLYIQSGSAVGEVLRGRLEGSGVQMTAKESAAGLRLRILSQGQDSRVVAVDRQGRALAYVQRFEVRFDAVDRAGEPVLSAQSVVLERTFDDNPNVSVLGKQLESDIIFQTMADDAADQILLRLRAALAARDGAAVRK